MQVQDGAITTAALVNGPAARDIRVKNPWPAGRAGRQRREPGPGRRRHHQRRDIITIPAAANGTYLIQRPSAPTDALPKAPLSGTAEHRRAPPGRLERARSGIDPPGLRAADARARSRRRRRCSRGTRPPATRSRDCVDLRPRRPVGRRRGDLPGHRPDRARAPSISGTRYLRTPTTTLGFLREATWAAEIKINAGHQLPPALGLEDAERRRRRRLPDRPHAERPGPHHHLRPRRDHQRRAADRALHQPGHHRRPRRRPRRLRRRRADRRRHACPTSASTAARRPSCASAPTRAAASASAPSSTARRCSPRCSTARTARAGRRWRS